MIARAILEAWEAIALPDAWLVAGCLFQTVWNVKCGRAPEAGIRDYDLFYFDGDDLSGEAEARVQARLNQVFGRLGVPIEVHEGPGVRIIRQKLITATAE